jgi:AmmeMemoRadiSam system protein A
VAYTHPLADDEKRELLRIAHATLREYLDSGRLPPGKPHRQSLLTPAAVWIGLTGVDSVRGCAGSTVARSPLYRAVQEAAIAAASDRRQPLLAPMDLDAVVVEVAVLGPDRAVRSPDELVVGVDGIAITCDGQRGLVAPQAATAGGDPVALCARACVDAGLPADAWRRPDAQLTAFSAQVFSDRTHPRPR